MAKCSVSCQLIVFLLIHFSVIIHGFTQIHFIMKCYMHGNGMGLPLMGYGEMGYGDLSLGYEFKFHIFVYIENYIRI